MKKIASALILSTLILFGCGADLSETDREIRRVEKETRRLEKELKKRGITIPKEEEQQTTALIRSLENRNLKSARFHYNRLRELQAITDKLESETLSKAIEILEAYDADDHSNRYLSYSLLSEISPENTDYTQNRDTHANNLVSELKTRLDKLDSDFDKIEGITWYRHPHQPREPSVILYLGMNDSGRLWLRAKGEYHSKYGWLFVDRITAWYDGQKSIFVAGDFERRNRSAYIRETLDISPTDRQTSILVTMSEADDAVLRFEGKKGNRDYTLTKRDKNAISEIITLFEDYKNLRELGLELN